MQLWRHTKKRIKRTGQRFHFAIGSNRYWEVAKWLRLWFLVPAPGVRVPPSQFGAILFKGCPSFFSVEGLV